MNIIECLEEIGLAITKCKRNDCEHCPYEPECLEVFGKTFIETEVHNLASQCKAFNEFARANKKGSE